MPSTRRQGGDPSTRLENREVLELSEFLKLSSRPVPTGRSAEHDLLISLALALRSTTRSC